MSIPAEPHRVAGVMGSRGHPVVESFRSHAGRRRPRAGRGRFPATVGVKRHRRRGGIPGGWAGRTGGRGHAGLGERRRRAARHHPRRHRALHRSRRSHCGVRDRARRRRPAPGRHPVDGSPPAVPARRADAPPVPRVGRKRRSTFAEVVRLAHASAGDGINSARERHGRDSDHRPDEGLRRGARALRPRPRCPPRRDPRLPRPERRGQVDDDAAPARPDQADLGLGDAARARQPG